MENNFSGLPQNRSKQRKKLEENYNKKLESGKIEKIENSPEERKRLEALLNNQKTKINSEKTEYFGSIIPGNWKHVNVDYSNGYTSNSQA